MFLIKIIIMKTVSMKPVVQSPRKDGFWTVYIRFTFDGRCQFWKTSKVVSSQNVKSKSEITDPYVLSYCSSLILQWMEKLNHVDYSMWSIKDIVEYVTTTESHVSFSNYARTYIEKIDKPRTAKNYTLALKHLEKYMGSCELMFQSLTESSLNAWIDAMIRDGKKRAKEMYRMHTSYMAKCHERTECSRTRNSKDKVQSMGKNNYSPIGRHGKTGKKS